MKVISTEDERKYGLVPNGRFSNNTALKLFNGLMRDYDIINISIQEPEYVNIKNERKLKFNYKFYRLTGLDGNDCLLQEIKTYFPSNATPEQLLSGEISGIQSISNEVRKFNACDICNMKDTYLARIEVE